MPFTFSHPAAVLPIHSRFEKWIPLSALVVGSLMPDAAYYLPLPEHFKQTSHTFLGTFSSSLPLGILMWVLFCWLATAPGFLLPVPVGTLVGLNRTHRPALLQIALGAIVGIWLGAWSHVLWDSFTHERGWFVKNAATLRQPLLPGGPPVFKFLQYVSSVLGLCVLLYTYDKWLKASGFQSRDWLKLSWRFYLWAVTSLICLAAAALEANGVAAISNLFLHKWHPAFEFFTTFVRNILIALCVVSIAAKLLHRNSGTTSA